MRTYRAATGVAAAASMSATAARLDLAQWEGLAAAGLLIALGLQQLLRPWRLSRVMGAALCSR